MDVIDQTRIDRIVTIDSPDRGRELADNFRWLQCDNMDPYEEAWQDYSANFLTTEGTSQMYYPNRDHQAVLAEADLSNSKVIRVLFATCQTDLRCDDGNFVVNRAAADWSGAYLIAPVGEEALLTSAHKKAVQLCKESGSDSTTGIVYFSDAAVGQSSSRKLHGDGTAHYAAVLSNLALDRDLSSDPIGRAPYTLPCDQVDALETEKAETLVARVAFSSAAPQGSLISADENSSVVGSREGRNYRILVHAEPGRGRYLMVDVERAEIGQAGPGAVRVYLDNEPVTSAASYEQFVLADQGGEPKFLLTMGLEKVQIAVWVPHFSTRTILVELPGEASGFEGGFPARFKPALGNGFEEALVDAYSVLAATPPVFGVNPWLLGLIGVGILFLIGRTRTKRSLRNLEEGIKEVKQELLELRRLQDEGRAMREAPRAAPPEKIDQESASIGEVEEPGWPSSEAAEPSS